MKFKHLREETRVLPLLIVGNLYQKTRSRTTQY